MLPKTKRLTSAQVREVLKDGKSLKCNDILAKYLPAKTGKAAMIVSKKVAKTAVARNQLRRKGYAALPKSLPKAHVLFFIRTKDFDSTDISTVCSKLSS